MKRTYVIDGVEASYDDGWPEPNPKKSPELDSPLLAAFLTAPEPDWAERFITSLMDAFADIAEQLIAIPPLSWLDTILRGSVTPPK